MTAERLAQVLHANGLFAMETKARAFQYDDWKSDSATPIIDLVRDLQLAAGERGKDLNELIARAIGGEFDGSKAESDAWAQSEDGKRTIAQLTPAMRRVFNDRQ